MAAPMTKEQYIEAIIEVLQNCNDIDLIDLVFRITVKTVAVD
jgi:hypothetical protein